MILQILLFDEDDITITELMWDIHNDITLAELARQVTREEKRLKKKKERALSDEEEPYALTCCRKGARQDH